MFPPMAVSSWLRLAALRVLLTMVLVWKVCFSRLDIKGTDGKWTPVDLDAKEVTFGAGEGTSAQVSGNYATNGYIKTGANGVIKDYWWTSPLQPTALSSWKP